MSGFRFKVCESEQDIKTNHDLIAEIYPDVSRKEYEGRIAGQLAKHGHKQLVAYDGEAAVGLAGFTEGYRLYKEGEVIQIHNAVVKKEYRHKGIGKELFDWLEDYARKKKCRMVIFDSYYDNEQAHKFFYRGGYTIKAYTFMKDL